MQREVPEITGPGGLLGFDGDGSQPLRPETRSTDEPLWAHTQGRGPFGGPSGSRVPGSRPTPGFSFPDPDLGLGRAGETVRKGISGELLGRSGWGSEMRGPRKACHRCVLQTGNQRLGKTTGMLGPLPPATLGDGISLHKP